MRKMVSQYGAREGGTIIDTYSHWLWQLYKDSNRLDLVKARPRDYEWDYNVVADDFKGELLYDHIVLDEAQDFPVALVKILNSISSSMTVFMDENQSVEDAPKSEPNLDKKSAVQCVLDLDTTRVLPLIENHRNPQPLADLASKFLPAGSLPSYCVKQGTKKPELTVYTSLSNFVKKVDEYASENPEQTIAVLCANKGLRSNAFSKLKEINSSARTLKEYISNKETPGFNALEINAVHFLSYETHKGLEYDAVFMPALDDKFFVSETEIKRNKVMVAITRAGTNVFLGAAEFPGNNSFVLKIIDENRELVDIVDATSANRNEISEEYDEDIPF